MSCISSISLTQSLRILSNFLFDSLFFDVSTEKKASVLKLVVKLLHLLPATTSTSASYSATASASDKTIDGDCYWSMLLTSRCTYTLFVSRHIPTSTKHTNVTNNAKNNTKNTAKEPWLYELADTLIYELSSLAGMQCI
jgi:hypothetical protein